MFWAGMRPISKTGNYGRFDAPDHPVLYTSPNSMVISNEVDDLTKYKYKITYTLKHPIYVVAPFFYEESNSLVESQQQLKLNYFYNNILTIKKGKDVSWNNRLYVVTNLILNRFDTTNADGFIYQSVETFRKYGMKNGLTISNNRDPSLADANLALFSDDLFSKYEVEEIQ